MASGWRLECSVATLYRERIRAEITALDRSLPIRMAMFGLGIMGLESVLIAPASAMHAATILGRHFLIFQSTVTQVLLAGVMVIALCIGLAHRSRAAYLIALVVGVAPIAVWLSLYATADPMALRPVMVRLAAAALVVLAGLALDWSSFWRPRTGSSS